MPIPSLIAVAGLIGVGKTTLAQQLSRLLSAHLILEEYDKNPFLPRQLTGETTAALPSELFFLLSRARQLDPNNIDPAQTCICDYIFAKNRIYARMFLSDHQFSIYDEVESLIAPHLTPPSVVIYLTNSIETCHSRILSRGREFEQTITPDWLSRLSRAYDSLFQHWSICPLLRLDCCSLDLRLPETAKDVAQQLIRSKATFSHPLPLTDNP